MSFGGVEAPFLPCEAVVEVMLERGTMHDATDAMGAGDLGMRRAAIAAAGFRVSMAANLSRRSCNRTVC